MGGPASSRRQGDGRGAPTARRGGAQEGSDLVARSEVWWYEDADAGRRPYLILTRTEAIPVLTRVLAAPATTVVRGIPTEVPLDRHDGMPRPCVVALDNIALIRPALCTERITRLGPEAMARVCTAIRAATAC